jgi:hypothetical protein
MALEDDLCDCLVPGSGVEENLTSESLLPLPITPLNYWQLLVGLHFSFCIRAGGDKITTQLPTLEESYHRKQIATSARVMLTGGTEL